MKKFGLIGFPLGHSFSKNFFKEKFIRERYSEIIYENYEINSLEKLPDILTNNPDLRGFNVTIPYKEKIISLLDDIDIIAKKIGSVNTVKISDGKLIGYNTDYLGFRESIISWLPNTNISALVLGSGGSSKAIKYVLDDLRISYKVISRDSKDMKISYKELKNLSMISTSKLIINTTPLGMSPNVDGFPDIDYNLINNKHFVFDLVYNPIKTKFLSLCEERGANIKNGYEMLVAQAEEAWKIWNK
tara:strand:+ start:1303 stop:2037 length:735 start_codon:yes stop_codon:yes gene_type:complete